MRFQTTTRKGVEGFNISYSKEKSCAEALLKVLPKDWKVKFSWYQILMSDVQYEIDFEKKEVEITYNQNLLRWWAELQKEIEEKIEKKE